MTKVLIERVKRGMKQYELANQVGITPQYLRLIEKGRVDPKLGLMLKLSEALEINVIDLFFSEEER